MPTTMEFLGEIEGALDAKFFKTGSYASRVSWPNLAFDPPDPAEGKWARVTTFLDAASRSEFGLSPTRIRQVGTLIVDLFFPAGSATDEVRKEVDRLARTMQSKQFGHVRTRAAVPGRGSRAGAWFKFSVRIPFVADATG